jgi:hypothetical protein
LSLVDWYQSSNEPLVKEIAFSMIEAGNIFQDIPLITNATLLANGSRVIGGLPAPHWTPINGEPSAVKGKPVSFQEQLWVIRDSIDMDHFIFKDKNQIGNPFDVQVDMYLKGLSYDLNDKFINNEHITGDKNAFVGIRARLDDPEQFGTNPACKIDAGGTDLSDDGLTGSTANVLIRQLQSLLDEMGSPDGTNVVIYMNDDLLRRVEQGIRELGAGGGFDLTRDNFDRRVLQYKNAKIRNVGRKSPSADGTQSTHIITSTEPANGLSDTGGSYTSLYAVKYGKNSFAGWQFEPLKPSGPEKLNNGVTYRIVFDWGVGLWQPNSRAVGRLYGIKVA